MQRVRIPGGILSAGQWRALADIARRITPITPLHLTARQDLELHDLSDADVPRAEHALAEAGLTSLGSGGDTLRNIVVCPCAAGGTSETPNLLPLAGAIGRALAEYEGLFALPRKFKISLGCEQGCGRPFVHDLSFVAIRRDGRWGLKVIGAGSLGPKPAPGVALFDWIEPGEALPLSLAAVRVFARHGDRQNRGQARLRHVRQRLGDETFRANLRQEFEAVKAERSWPAVVLAVAGDVVLAKRIFTFANGDVTSEQTDALGRLAELPGVSVRIGSDHRVVVFAADGVVLDDAINRAPSLSAAARTQVNVVACPGTRWCSRALADTNGLGDRIRTALAGHVDKDVMVSVSGCPNGCAGTAVADVGLLGGRSIIDGQPVEKYAILSGGGGGASDILADPVAVGLSADQAVAEVVRLAKALASGPVGRGSVNPGGRK